MHDTNTYRQREEYRGFAPALNFIDDSVVANFIMINGGIADFYYGNDMFCERCVWVVLQKQTNLIKILMSNINSFVQISCRCVD